MLSPQGASCSCLTPLCWPTFSTKSHCYYHWKSEPASCWRVRAKWGWYHIILTVQNIRTKGHFQLSSDSFSSCCSFSLKRPDNAAFWSLATKACWYLAKGSVTATTGPKREQEPSLPGPTSCWISWDHRPPRLFLTCWFNWSQRTSAQHWGDVWCPHDWAAQEKKKREGGRAH